MKQLAFVLTAAVISLTLEILVAVDMLGLYREANVHLHCAFLVLSTGSGEMSVMRPSK